MNIENLIYKANEYKYNFHRFETIRSFGRNIPNGEITKNKADIDQSN